MTNKEQIIINGVDVSGCSAYENGLCLIDKDKCNARCLLLNEYKRTLENFDKCMEAFERIIIICEKQKNYEVAKVIESTLNKLDSKRTFNTKADPFEHC